MNKENIIEILDSWNFWKRDQNTGVLRQHYLDKMNSLIKTGQVVALTGVRRSGKSTLMKQFIKQKIASREERESFLYVNFEEPKFADSLSLKFLQQIYEAYLEIVKPKSMPYILLDEVQLIPKWESFVRGIHEKKEARVLVSGSTSKILSKEFGEKLTGRWSEIKVYPLAFSEFLNFKGVELKSRLDMASESVKIRQLLREYLEFGGFPLVSLNEEKQEILVRYFEDIISRDIAERHKVRKVEKLKPLAKYYLTNFSSMVSYRKTAHFIGLSLDSIERFSKYMEDAFLLFFVHKFSYSLKEQEVNLRKVYCIDLGLINVVSFRFSENIGRLYENLVYIDLIKKGKEVYYYKNGGECDFIVKEGTKIIKAIQVSYQIDGNKEREVKGLLEALEAFGLKEGFIITESLEAEEKIQGKKIVYIPLWKWLLQS